MSIDPKFLEWFGQMLVSSAKNLEQAESFFELFREGLPPGTKAEKWLEPYLSLMPKGKPEFTQDFQTLAQELFKNLGVVSRQEYRELQRQHEELKARFEEFQSGFEQVRNVEKLVRSQSPALADAWLDMVKQTTQTNHRLFDLYKSWFGLGG